MTCPICRNMCAFDFLIALQFMSSKREHVQQFHDGVYRTPENCSCSEIVYPNNLVSVAVSYTYFVLVIFLISFFRVSCSVLLFYVVLTRPLRHHLALHGNNRDRYQLHHRADTCWHFNIYKLYRLISFSLVY